MNGWLLRLLILLVAAGACGLRLPELDRRPLHNDEAVNAWILRDLADKGTYRYDPHEYHGPTLHYLSLPFVKLAPAHARMSDANLRVAPVVFGAALILLLLPLASGLGRAATLASAVLLAVSPAFVFYSRYFIHEIFLIFFTFLALGAGWRYVQTGRWPWAVLCGAGVGLMYATKETFVFQAAAMLAGAAAVAWENSRRDAAPLTGRPWWNARHWALAAGAGVVVAVVLFTSFFSNPRGVLDAVLTYEPWFARAGGASPLNKPWSYFFERLVWFHPPKSPVWTEGAILLLALVGAGAALTRRVIPGVNLGLARFLVVYTVLLTFVYNAIPYKTPWCMLVFHQGFVLLAGVGVAFVWSRCRPWPAKAVVLAVLLAAAGHLALQAWRAAVPFAAERSNPYVHSQTTHDVHNLVKKVKAVAAVHPDGTNMLIKVVSPVSYWPLPWYLREFTRVGWWDTSQLPEDPWAPVILVNHSLDAYLDEKSNKEYIMVGLHALRPDTRRPPQNAMEMYVEFKLWERYINSLPKRRPGEEE